MEQWITLELETTELGDIRRTKRLIKIVENLSARLEEFRQVAYKHLGRAKDATQRN
ncbi:IS4/Tn5 family transposase DNA-binding protein [Nostoc sp.]|uniref:IS4/Tn5 family transposase DNA-binding protein n=1 Tax=Nostoc sp. TaxID=1180 RepID=UPI002FF6201B